MCLARNPKHVERITEMVLALMSDSHIQVRQKACRLLTGLIHTQILSEAQVAELLSGFRAQIRPQMVRSDSTKTGGKAGKSGKAKSPKKAASSSSTTRFRKRDRELLVEDKNRLVQVHSGVLGLCAYVQAFPFEVPEAVPAILVELEGHLNDPQPIPRAIKDMIGEFKRTHIENWGRHKLKFTEDQLSTLTDHLISPNYYA